MGVVKLTAETYERTRSAPGIVLIQWQRGGDDGAPPVGETLVESGVVTVATIDGEAESKRAALAHVTTLPTLVMYRDGLEVFRSVDPLRPGELEAIIASVRDLDMQDIRERVAMQDADDHRGG